MEEIYKMDEENKQEDNNLKEEQVLLQEYKKLQENTVSKEKYEHDINELKEKNKLYLNAITEGKEIEVAQQNTGSLEDAIVDLSKFKGTNLQYWEKTSSAIDRMLKEMPEAEITKITGTEGLEELVKVNEGMKQMVKDANGDPDYFRALYKSRVKDDAPRISAEIEKAGGLFNYLQGKNK